jgi:hypothetical protein
MRRMLKFVTKEGKLLCELHDNGEMLVTEAKFGEELKAAGATIKEKKEDEEKEDEE